ncbi:MAG: alpha/beta hydrolase [Pseudomonadales bacterium]|jgi:pimeloyl-ACP methyl ester carboxylesterase
MTEPIRHRVDVGGVGLNLYEIGADSSPSDSPPVVMLHGMRDVSLSLLPVAVGLAGKYPVYLLDLRGHGESDQPGGYSMAQMVHDLREVLDRAVPDPAVLFGHSLGGHVVCRCAALYPDLVRAAIVVEGLGPPAGRRPEDPDEALLLEGERLRQMMGLQAGQRPLPSLAFAAERLLANNPRLDPERALTLARHGTTTNAAGELVWAFDPRVQSVFVGADSESSERYWAGVRCPTLIVAGALSAEYWRRAVPADSAWTGEFQPGELEARVATFRNAELTVMAGSGHMVHFDEPDALTKATLDFLRRRL